MVKLSSKVLNKIQNLWARMLDPASAPAEAEKARSAILELLKNHGYAWRDLQKIMADIEIEKAATEAAAAAATRARGWKPPNGDDLGIPNNDLLGLMLAVMEQYIFVPPEDLMAIALWCLHSHVFFRFPVTPRLLLISPVENCGKTTVLKVLNQLAYEPDMVGNTTAAAIYLLLQERPGTTQLIDEADNQNLVGDSKLRAIFNKGYEHGSIRRGGGGRSQVFQVGAPLALATIRALPRPLMSRSIAVNMHRSPVELKIFDAADPAWIVVREAIQKWAARCTLSPEPEVPEGFHGRLAANWRPLLSIADDLGFTHGETARSAAMVLGSSRQYENPLTTLLTDIRTVFDMSQASRLVTKTELIPALAGLEDSMWADWAGMDDMGVPHLLTQGDLGRLLGKDLGIRSKTLWPPRRRQDTKSPSGDFIKDCIAFAT
jgi:Protein of unknown function (DUF3631)